MYIGTIKCVFELATRAGKDTKENNYDNSLINYAHSHVTTIA
jgi:hypothetical protein